MRRGFPAQAERLAASVRAELGLDLHDRLDPEGLAEEYGVPVVPITDLIAEGALSASIQQLTVIDDGCFSAGTVLAGSSRLIIFNPVHGDGRLANSVTHELAHLLLEHRPGPAIGPGGCRVWDQEMEDEANLLAATLLVSRDAALACARVGLPHEIGAARFGVSTELMRWRTGHSGAARQAQAAARKQGRTLPRPKASDIREVMSACDVHWLKGLTAYQWQVVLSTAARALESRSLPALIRALNPPRAAKGA